MTVKYDAIGVLILPCRSPHRFKAQRVGLRNGTIEVIEEITDNRNIMSAHKAALGNLELLATELSRSKYELAQKERPSLKFE